MPSLVDEYKAQVNGHLDAFYGWLERLDNRLEVLVEGSKARIIRQEYRSLSNQLQLSGGATAGTLEFPPVPAGVFWLVTLIAVTESNGGDCDVFVNETSPASLRWHFPDAPVAATPPSVCQEDSGGFIFVREQEKLLFKFFGQAANTLCTVALQVKQYPLEALEQAHGGQFTM